MSVSIDLPQFNRNLSCFYSRMDETYRFSHLDAELENSHVINSLFFAEMPVLRTDVESRNGVFQLRVCLDTARLVRSCPSTVLASLPSLLSNVDQRCKAKARIKNIGNGFIPIHHFHEKQRNGLCLVHSLNNVFGSRVFTSSGDDRLLVDGCINLWNVSQSSSSTPYGEYADDAIPRACDVLGVDAAIVPPSASVRCVWGSMRVNPAFLGAVLLRNGHFTSLTQYPDVPGGFVVIDSRDSSLREWENGEMIPVHLQKMQSIHFLFVADMATARAEGLYVGERFEKAKQHTAEGKILSKLLGSMW